MNKQELPVVEIWYSYQLKLLWISYTEWGLWIFSTTYIINALLRDLLMASMNRRSDYGKQKTVPMHTWDFQKNVNHQNGIINRCEPLCQWACTKFQKACWPDSWQLSLIWSAASANRGSGCNIIPSDGKAQICLLWANPFYCYGHHYCNMIPKL